MNKSFWNNKKVLITGNTGFKGSWLSCVLLGAGADICGYALENDCPKSIFNAIGLENAVDCHYGDICDEQRLGKIISQFRPEIVFHLAAQPIVRISYVTPLETYRVNVMGTATLLNCIRSADSVRTVVNVTTDKVYANDDKTAFFSETDNLGGYDPYSSSKACSELVTSAFVSSYFNPVEYGKSHKTAIATARAGNVIGGGDFAPDRLVPDCIRAVEQGSEVIIRNPEAIRPWQNVLEPLSLYITLAEKLYNDGTEYNGAWNVGPSAEDCVSVRNVIGKLQEYLPKLKVKMGGDNSKLHEASLLTLNSEKIKQRLGFKSRWNIDEAVKYTALWYLYQLENKDMSEITDRIIGEYFG